MENSMNKNGSTQRLRLGRLECKEVILDIMKIGARFNLHNESKERTLLLKEIKYYYMITYPSGPCPPECPPPTKIKEFNLYTGEPVIGKDGKQKEESIPLKMFSRTATELNTPTLVPRNATKASTVPPVRKRSVSLAVTLRTPTTTPTRNNIHTS